MEAVGQLHAPAALPQVLTEERCGWAHSRYDICGERDKTVAPPVFIQPVAILPALSRLHDGAAGNCEYCKIYYVDVKLYVC
jgi:hypothetical protein